MSTVHVHASRKSKTVSCLVAAAVLLLGATAAIRRALPRVEPGRHLRRRRRRRRHTSASVGTVTYDGEGNVTRSLVVNAPDGSGNGGRRLLEFESEGTYVVNPDGTGTISVTNRISNGTTSEVTFDFVIQESQPYGKGGQRRATKLYGVQREGGTTVSLVTTTRDADGSLSGIDRDEVRSADDRPNPGTADRDAKLRALGFDPDHMVDDRDVQYLLGDAFREAGIELGKTEQETVVCTLLGYRHPDTIAVGDRVPDLALHPLDDAPLAQGGSQRAGPVTPGQLHSTRPLVLFFGSYT